MQLIARIRVYTNRISRVLVKVCFCRGLLGNTEKRPTCHDYIEIITNRAIFYNLEDFRRGGKKQEAKGRQP